MLVYCLNTEVKRLKEYLAEFSVHQYQPTLDVVEKYKDGGIAIIDQWICAHARYEISITSVFSLMLVQHFSCIK